MASEEDSPAGITTPEHYRSSVWICFGFSVKKSKNNKQRDGNMQTVWLKWSIIPRRVTCGHTCWPVYMMQSLLNSLLEAGRKNEMTVLLKMLIKIHNLTLFILCMSLIIIYLVRKISPDFWYKMFIGYIGTPSTGKNVWQPHALNCIGNLHSNT